LNVKILICMYWALIDRNKIRRCNEVKSEGKTVSLKGFTSKAGKKYDAVLRYDLKSPKEYIAERCNF